MNLFGKKEKALDSSELVERAANEAGIKLPDGTQKPEVLTHRHSFAFYPGIYGVPKITPVKGGYDALSDCLPLKMMACQECGDIKFIALAVYEKVLALQIENAKKAVNAQQETPANA